MWSNLTKNVILTLGVEFMYEMYDPKIQKIEVLRLEKRLDSELVYLRDAEPEFSTFPFDMEPVYRPEGEPVPVNPLKVRTSGRDWFSRKFTLKQIVPNSLGSRERRKSISYS